MNDERLQNRNDHHSTWNMSPGKKKIISAPNRNTKYFRNTKTVNLIFNKCSVS